MAEAEDEPPILLPCAICARTFKPQSLEKHTRICERAGIKKRKPFDSAKQRIQGTELAEFLPKQEKKRTIQEDRHCKPKTSWKQTHNEFLRAIRAARGEVVEVPTQRHGPSVVPTGAPTRANEKGMCPTCNRLFGIKAYDRHVAWCKERAIRLPISPATNIAKERLEARMKYRAPALKNRRLTNREKYSPGSAINLSLASKSSPPFITTKAKESTSVPNCNKGGDSPINPKTIVARRPGQNRDQPVTSGTAKSRLAEQTNRPIEDCESGSSTTQSSRPNFQRRSHLPVLPSKSVKPKIITSASSHSKHESKLDVTSISPQRGMSNEQKMQMSVSARSQKGNLILGKVYDNPKVNDIAVNDEVIGMIVQPCNIHHQDQDVVTWKQISDEKNRRVERGEIVSNFVEKKTIRAGSTNEFRINEKIEISECRRRKSAAAFTCEQSTNSQESSLEIENITWASNIQKLDRTYLIKESIGTDVDCADVVPARKWKPVKNNPRIEFRLKDVGDSDLPVKLDEDYESYCNTLTHFNENMNLTSTPMPNKGNSMTETKSDCDHFGEPANWSGGLKLEEPESLELGFLESDVQGSQGSMKSSETKSSLSEKMKKVKLTTKRVPFLKSVSNDELVLNESFNVRHRNEDYETTKSSRSSCERNDLFVESSDTKYKDCKILRSTWNEGNFEENPVKKSFSNSFTPKSFDCLPIEVSEYSKDIRDHSGRRSNENMTIVDVFNCSVNQLNLKDTEENRTKEKNRNSIDTKTDSANSNCRSTSCFRSYEHSKEVLDENENSTYETSNKNSTQHPSLALDDRAEVEVDEGKINIKLDSISLAKDESSWINIANNSAKLEESTRRRCGTYVIEKTSAGSTKHRVSNESIDDRPLQKRQKVENIESLDMNDNESDDDLLDSTTMSRSLLETTNEAEIAIDNEMRQIYEKYVNSNFDYDSDNTVGDQPMKDPDTNGESFTCKELIVAEEKSVNDLRSKTLSEPYVTLDERKLQEMGKTNRTNVAEIQRKIRHSMNILRGSTDTLISSVEAVRSNEKKANSHETEMCTIKAIGCPRSERLRIEFLPKIDGEMTKLKNEGKSKERQMLYWERASKTSQNKLITLDPPKNNFRLLKRNPKIQILPPMLSANSPSDQQSPVQGNRQRNGQVSDEELSSPDSYKRSQDHSKLSADSAYSSLNRKYSNHGRSTNDVASRLEEEASRRRDTNATLSKYKMSKFCHECGSKFPETAKFCCECGIKRLAL